MDRKALIVGINEYPSSKLQCCVNDAKEIANLLKSNWNTSINFDIELLVDSVNKSELKSKIKKLFSGNSECALFFFSGHGYIEPTGGYIVTSDCEKEYPGINMDEIMIIINKSECKNRIVILDCCHSGQLGTISCSENISAIHDGVTILSACRDEEVALESEKHGIFTNLLINGLKGEAADIMGNITPGGLYSYVDRSLGPWDQRPVFKTNISNFISIRQSEPLVSRDILIKTIKYFKNYDEKLKLDPSFEYTNSPSCEHKIIEPYANHENVSIFKNLQKLESIGLVEPVDEKHMYYAAMNSKQCKLTDLGKYYWKLIKKERI